MLHQETLLFVQQDLWKTLYFGACIWLRPSGSQPIDHFLPYACLSNVQWWCGDDAAHWSSHQPQSQQTEIIFFKKIVSESVGTRIIRLDRGYSIYSNTQCNARVICSDGAWGHAELTFVLYHLFSKHIKRKAEINPRASSTPRSKDKKEENYCIRTSNVHVQI